MEIILTKRNKPKLVLNGYEYWHNSRKNNTHYWYCKEKKDTGCSGSVTTLFQDNNHLIKSSKKHNHGPPLDKVEAQKVVNNIKKRCLETGESSTTIILDEKNKTNESTRYHLPSNTALAQTIKRCKKKNKQLKGITFS